MFACVKVYCFCPLPATSFTNGNTKFLFFCYNEFNKSAANISSLDKCIIWQWNYIHLNNMEQVSFYHEKQRLQKLVFPEGIPYKRDTGFGTARLGLIFELNRESRGQKSHVVPSRGIEPLSRDPQSRVLSVERRGQCAYGATLI